MQRHRRGWMAFHRHVVGRVDEPCCGYPKATGSGLFLEAVPVVAGTTLGSGGTTRWCACAENGVIEAVPSARAHAGSFCGSLAQLGSTGRLAGLPWPSPRSWPAPGAAAKQQAGANASAIGRPCECYRLPVSERLGLPEARRIVAPRAARCTKFGNLVGLVLSWRTVFALLVLRATCGCCTRAHQGSAVVMLSPSRLDLDPSGPRPATLSTVAHYEKTYRAPQRTNRPHCPCLGRWRRAGPWPSPAGSSRSSAPCCQRARQACRRRRARSMSFHVSPSPTALSGLRSAWMPPSACRWSSITSRG